MKRYTVKVYYCGKHSCLMEHFETNSWHSVEEFVLENCQGGYNCIIINNETGSQKWAYAEDFSEGTVEPKDLIREIKKTCKSIFYEDLLMEQQEQM